jgi:hypothetical protein
MLSITNAWSVKGCLSSDELWALESKEGNYAKVARRGRSAQEYL